MSGTDRAATVDVYGNVTALSRSRCGLFRGGGVCGSVVGSDAWREVRVMARVSAWDEGISAGPKVI